MDSNLEPIHSKPNTATQVRLVSSFLRFISQATIVRIMKHNKVLKHANLMQEVIIFSFSRKFYRSALVRTFWWEDGDEVSKTFLTQLYLSNNRASS